LFQTLLVACGHWQPAPDIGDSPLAVSTLATELIGNERLLPALVEAERLDHNPVTTRLMISALEQAADELDDQSAACSALADLNEVIGDHDQAQAWRSRAQAIPGRRDDVLASIGLGGITMQDGDAVAVHLRGEAA
jgi:hypothetical protein